ncbi:uncharacterized protein A4U43_C01F12240 [Asparagus officinalis]|uniref:Uncharacterized protein n=1 Tax=Asparagus officinalis TaxID=4686 RepID=A0A5P1FNR4_ASPOF|nr:uncharacterized protein A4U43_C01F12240 [Asparagus officinalis]
MNGGPSGFHASEASSSRSGPQEAEFAHVQPTNVAIELAGTSLVDRQAKKRRKLNKVSSQGPGREAEVETKVILVDNGSPAQEERVDL